MEENKKPENPQAFPQTWERDGSTDNWENGMTLRDYFAAKAMQGIYSNSEWMKEYKGDKYLMQIGVASEVSYSIADAMLKQREL